MYWQVAKMMVWLSVITQLNNRGFLKIAFPIRSPQVGLQRLLSSGQQAINKLNYMEGNREKDKHLHL